MEIHGISERLYISVKGEQHLYYIIFRLRPFVLLKWWNEP